MVSKKKQVTEKEKKFINLPSEEEIEKITNYFSDPNCKGINEGLMPNASELDKTKYCICQSISRYKRINNLTSDELAKKIKVNKGKVDNILFSRFYTFNLEELISYAEKLHGRMEVKISYDSKRTAPETR